MFALYRTLFRIGVAVQVQYRASGIIWMIGGVLDPIIFLIVWSTVANAQGGEVAGYSVSQFAGYYLTLMLVNHLTFTWIMHEFQWRIQEGQFSFLLLRPVHPIHGDLADNFAYKLVMMVVMVPAVAILALWFRPTFETEPWAVLAALPALILAILLRFFLGWTLALAAFWTTRTTAINQMYFALLLVFSGRVAPVDLLPPWLQRVGEGLPFYWVAAFPVEVIIGRLSPQEVIHGLGMQLVWTLLSLAVLAGGWRFAVRRFSAVGG